MVGVNRRCWQGGYLCDQGVKNKIKKLELFRTRTLNTKLKCLLIFVLQNIYFERQLNTFCNSIVQFIFNDHRRLFYGIVFYSRRHLRIRFDTYKITQLWHKGRTSSRFFNDRHIQKTHCFSKFKSMRIPLLVVQEGH